MLLETTATFLALSVFAQAEAVLPDKTSPRNPSWSFSYHWKTAGESRAVNVQVRFEYREQAYKPAVTLKPSQESGECDQSTPEGTLQCYLISMHTGDNELWLSLWSTQDQERIHAEDEAALINPMEYPSLATRVNFWSRATPGVVFELKARLNTPDFVVLTYEPCNEAENSSQVMVDGQWMSLTFAFEGSQTLIFEHGRWVFTSAFQLHPVVQCARGCPDPWRQIYDYEFGREDGRVVPEIDLYVIFDDEYVRWLERWIEENEGMPPGGVRLTAPFSWDP